MSMKIVSTTVSQNEGFPDRKLNLITKLFLSASVFIGIGFIVFLVSIFLSNAGLRFTEHSIVAFVLFSFLKIWGIVFAYILPFGLITIGVWSIIYKESAIKLPFPIKLHGSDAIIAGAFYLILGMIILWGVNGVVLSLLCQSSFCSTLPDYIRFF